MKCPSCGAEVRGRFCEYCGSEMPKEETVTNIHNKSKTIINNYYHSDPQNTSNNASKNYKPRNIEKSKSVAENTTKSYVIAILLLIFFFPAGLVMIWVQKLFPKVVRIIITVFFALMVIFTIFSSETGDSTTTNNTYTTSPVETPTPLYEEKENESLQDSFEKGFKDGLGDSSDESIENTEEHIDNIKESINEILYE